MGRQRRRRVTGPCRAQEPRMTRDELRRALVMSPQWTNLIRELKMDVMVIARIGRIKIENWNDEEAGMVESWIKGEAVYIPPIILGELDRYIEAEEKTQ